MILPVYKPVGESSHQLAALWGKFYQEKATHTGTLDPIADGVLIVATGDDRFNKEKINNGKKVYVATVLFGQNTDSHDILGLQTNQSKVPPLVELKKILSAENSKSPETFLQQLPDFSAKRINGKSSFDYAKKGLAVPKSNQSVTVFSEQWSNLKRIPAKELLKDITKRISTVKGDFRQKDCLISWNNLLNNAPTQTLATVTYETSKKTYIRACIRDFSKKNGVAATIVSLTRTKNGPYNLENCLCLI